MRLKVFICVLLAGITLAIYWPARHFQMIDLDDPMFLNPDAVRTFDWHGLGRMMTEVVAGNWHPVTMLSFLLVQRFYGINPFAEHMVNIFFHAANAVLLFLVLVKLTRLCPTPAQQARLNDVPAPDASADTKPETSGTPVPRTNLWLCAFVAAVFAWHPLRVESVAWIAERKDVLFMFFMLLAVWCYAGYAREGKGKRSYYGLALFFFFLSLMSKAMSVTLPFLLLLLDYWPLGRFKQGSTESRPTTKLMIEKIPFFALTIFFCILTYWVQKKDLAVRSLGQIGMGPRAENAILSYFQYFEDFFWPSKLAVIYPYPKSFDVVQVTLTAMLLLAISALCVLQLRRRPYLSMGWFWYLGTMVPVIGLVQVGMAAMADRYTYLPMIGPVLGLTWLASEWAAMNAWRRTLAILAAVSIMTMCVILARRQIGYWEDADRLFSRTIAVTPDNCQAQICLATALQYEGQYRPAAMHYRIAIGMMPKVFKTHYQLADCLTMAGQRDEALKEYRATITQDDKPNDYIENMILADAFEQVGEPEKAVAPLKVAVRLNPDSAKGLDDLAWILATSPDASFRDGTRAVELAERACVLTGYKQTLVIGTLAAAYAEAGRFDDAAATARKAIANAQQNGETELAARNQELLQVYLGHKAYHESGGE